LIEGLRTALASAEELLKCSDMDSLYKRGVELARDKFGVERCGIYIKIGDTWHGTFGIDIHGQTTDERLTSFPVKNDPDIAEFLEAIRKEPELIHWKEYYNRMLRAWDVAQGTLVDIEKGWVVMTAIRIPSSEDLEGILFNDAAITKKPIDKTQQEIIAVYCSLLGSLIAAKRTEEDLRQAREREVGAKLDAWRDFSAHASHRIGNEISSVGTLLDVLSEHLLKDSNYAPKWAESLSVMQGCVRAGKKMLSDLTVMTARITPRPKLTNLLNLVKRAALGVLPKQARLDLQHLPPDTEFLVDPDLMEQAFRELCTNAVRAVGKNLSLTIYAKKEGETLNISFQDNGPGIPDDQAKQIFEPFVTFQPGRTGLGLATVRHIIEAHGGSIRLQESTVGAHFVISLPLGEQK
jgi:signal transduction histidine kinase